MITHILEGIGGLYLIAMVSLLIGLLRSAKAASQVTEEQEQRAVENEKARAKDQPKHKSLFTLTAFLLGR